MRRTGLFFSAVLLIAAGVTFAQQNDKPKEAQEGGSVSSRIPPEAAAKTNPVKPTPEGLTQARKLYGFHCAMCHGKGDLGVQMNLGLKDWRDPNTISKFTDGELFYIITNGRGKMEGGEGDRTKEEVRWNMVNLVHSFAKKTEEGAAKP